MAQKFSDEFRQQFLKDLRESGLSVLEFCKSRNIAYTTAKFWLSKAGSSDSVTRKTKGPYTPEQRKQAIEAYFKSGLSQKDFAKTWGVPIQTFTGWLTRYRENGPKGLDGYAQPKTDDRRKGRKISEKVLEEIIKLKQADPHSGLKYIQQVMARFKGVRISKGAIKKTLEEAELPLVEVQKKRKRSADKVRFFERAKPMQLWQSDITSFVMTRHSQRVYLTVFMDDYSRYVVAWSLSVRQTTEFVSETLLEGVARFGKPEEVLTDQGRQYFAWRGKSDFQRILDREGIKHVVSRSHHPQTLGKCERFWETVGQEFWERVKPQDLSDAKSRFSHFINHYNHFRPHQGIEGLAPADRFFGLENEVRLALEATMAENELRLAIGEAPRSPVFLVGQIGDQPISLHGEGGKLVLRTQDGETRELSYGEFGHLKKGGDNGPAKDDPKTAGPEERDLDADAGADTCEGNLGVCEFGGEAEGPQDGSITSAVLDGTSLEERDRRRTPDSTASDLAALGASGGGNGGGTFEAAKNEERIKDEHQQGRRSEVPEETDRRTREDSLFVETVDRCAEGDARLYGYNDSPGRSGAGGDGEETT